ncbi:plasmid recombination protein [Kitasatospora phosalacinea]|uniref:plasmid recombination protein n=1 Tax=Kitasatospora phosalacinea TaxID=2065 RepID=UPI003660AC6F
MRYTKDKLCVTITPIQWSESGVFLMANYAVIRMEKYKKDRLNGTQKHNQREFQKSKNENIDRERTHFKYDKVYDKTLIY